MENRKTKETMEFHDSDVTQGRFAKLHETKKTSENENREIGCREMKEKSMV